MLRDIPGLVIASPARAADAPAMLRTCVAAAAADGTVCVFLEPIALYHTRDLHEPGDERWTAPYAPPARWGREHVPIGEPAVARDGDDVLVVTWGNGLYLSLRVAERLAAEGIACRVLDLRWLAPLPIDEVARARPRGRAGSSWSTRPAASGGVGEAVVAGLVEAGYRRRRSRGSPPHDSFIPLGDAASLVLVSEDDIEPPPIRAVVVDRAELPALRRALLGEGGHALGGVGAGEQLVGQAAHPLERLVAVERRHLAQDPLGRGDGAGRAQRMPSHSAATVRVDVVGDVGDQPDVAGLGGVERLAGEERRGQPAGARPAQDRHRDDRRGDADADLGEGERDVAWTTTRSHAAISPMPPARAGPLDGGDRRHLGVHQPLGARRRSGASRAGRCGAP